MLNDGSGSDEFYMQQALSQAQTAAAMGEIPVGALVVSSYGQIIGQGHNMVEYCQSQLQHAEGRAIQSAAQHMGNWRLDKCTLYVTLEPCMMCISLCALSRIERIVYGADSPVFGFRIDKEGVLALYTKQIKNITSGILAAESAMLLKDFFTKKRG